MVNRLGRFRAKRGGIERNGVTQDWMSGHKGVLTGAGFGREKEQLSSGTIYEEQSFPFLSNAGHSFIHSFIPVIIRRRPNWQGALCLSLLNQGALHRSASGFRPLLSSWFVSWPAHRRRLLLGI